VKRTVALISFWVALVLFGAALSSYMEEVKGTSPRRRDGFADLRSHSYAAVHRESQSHPDAQHFMAKVALAGVAFLIAGCALWGKSAPPHKPLAS
jgi:hypothetical protein